MLLTLWHAVLLSVLLQLLKKLILCSQNWVLHFILTFCIMPCIYEMSCLYKYSTAFIFFLNNIVLLIIFLIPMHPGSSMFICLATMVFLWTAKESSIEESFFVLWSSLFTYALEITFNCTTELFFLPGELKESTYLK